LFRLRHPILSVSIEVATHNAGVAFNNRGMELYNACKIDEASSQLRQALAIDPNFPEADRNLGPRPRRRRQDDEAIS